MSSQNILEKTSQAFASSWEMMPCPKASTASCISIEKVMFIEPQTLYLDICYWNYKLILVII